MVADADAAQLDCLRGTEAGAALDALSSYLSDPTVFVTAAPNVESAAKGATKAVFDHIAKQSAGCDGGENSGASMPSFALPELHVDGFDTEQIWLQVDLSLEAVLKRCKKLVKRATGAQTLLNDEAAGELLGDDVGSEDEDEDEDEDESEGDDDDIVDLDEDVDMGEDGIEGLEDEFGIDEEGNDEEGSEDDDDDDDDAGEEEEEEEEERAQKRAKQPKRGKRSAEEEEDLAPGEDKFFRFSDMDKFLDDAENQAENDDSNEEDGDEDEEDGGEGDPEEDDLEAALEKAVNKHKAKRRAAGEDSDEEEDDEEEEGDEGGLTGGAKYGDFFGEEEEEEGEGGDDDEDADGSEGDDMEQQGSVRKAKPSTDSTKRRGLLDEAEDEDESHLSSFERQQRKVMRKIHAMEEAAMSEKSWDMRGEVAASKRPLNSALEADLDFETGVKGVTEISDEAAENIEEMIKQRCAEGRFDDVIRVVVAPTEKKKAVLELDDQKSSAGLGELYEKDFVRAAAGGLSEDKHDPIRQEVKQLFGELCGKLDALSHFHYAPKPVVEELVIKAEVPALAMEEALPTAVSTASLKAPEETYKAATKGDLKAAEELNPSEKKTERAKRKRIAKRKRAEKDEARRNSAAAAGGVAPVAGRKSDAEERLAAKKSSKGSKGQKGQRSEFVKSGAVFGKLQDQQNALKAGIVLGAKKEKPAASTANLKL